MIPLHDDNPTERPPLVTVALIAACVLVFFWQLGPGAPFQVKVYQFGLVPAALFGTVPPPVPPAVDPWLTVFTSMFMHGGFMHLAGNMLYLWIFGNNVEDALGHGRFIVFYLLCGVVAALAQALPDPASPIPMVGASGAISGVLGAYLLLYPYARVLVAVPLGFYITTVYLPAGLVLSLWFLFQFISSLFAAGQQGGVAFRAHLGGFVAGMVLLPLFKRRGLRLFHPPRPRRR